MYDEPMAMNELGLDELNPVGIEVAGIRMLPVMGGQYKVWTKKMGSGPVKVLLLHGGPGFTHQYLEAMESFLPQAGIEMYYYDQLGCGNSDKPDDVALWNTPRFVEEVEDVRKGLGLENFVLYGQSWGSMLSMEYALKYQHNLRGLVLSNMTAGIKDYLRRLGEIVRQLPEELQEQLRVMEEAEDYENPEYMRLMMEVLYPMAICRCKPWPEPVTRAFRDASQQVYNTMQGKSEFVVTGYFKDWDRWADLHRIETKALVMGAEYDTMDPRDIERMAELMPNAAAAICPNGSHLAMWDDQAVYFEHLLGFLKTL